MNIQKEKKMKKSITRIIVFAVSLMLFSLLTGCDLSQNDVVRWESHEKAMETLLDQKYGIKFEVGAAEQLPAHQAFEKIYFQSDVVVCETGDTFTAMISEDNKILKDDYPQTIYKDEIEQRLNDICSRHPDIGIDERIYQYRKSEDIWSSIEQLDDYLENGPSWISMEITISEEDEEMTAQKLYDFLYDLASNHFQYDINCNYLVNDQSEILSFTMTGNKTDVDYAVILDEVKMANQKIKDNKDAID